MADFKGYFDAFESHAKASKDLRNLAPTVDNDFKRRLVKAVKKWGSVMSEKLTKLEKVSVRCTTITEIMKCEEMIKDHEFLPSEVVFEGAGSSTHATAGAVIAGRINKVIDTRKAAAAKRRR